MTMKRLIVKRIKVDGEYGFDEEFSDGLHILTGIDNSCGKSLFIRLIDFALGDDGKKLEEYNILKKCTFFYAEINILNEVFTIRRNINQIDKEIDVFSGHTIKEVIEDTSLQYESKDVEWYQKYLFKQLTGYDYIKTVAPVSGRFKTISFSFFSNLFYLNQGVEAGQIFRYNIVYFPNYLREKVLSLYLNTGKIKKSIPEVEIHNLKEDQNNSINKLNIERQFFSTNVTDNNYFGEIEKKKAISKEINSLREAIKEHDSRVTSLDLISKTEQGELIKKNREIKKTKEEIADLQFTIKQNTKLINDYREDIAKTEKNITAFNLFKVFELHECPECGKPLTVNKIDKNCPLCKEEYEDKKTDDKYIANNMAYLSYLKDSLNDCLEVVEKEKQDLENRKKHEKILTSEILKIENELREKINQLKNPILEQKLKYQAELSTNEQKLQEIESNLKILEEFRKEDTRIEDVREQIIDLNNEILKIDQNEDDKKKEKNLMEEFRANFNSFFNNINYPFFERGYIDNKFQIEVSTSKDGHRTMDNISSESDKIILRLGLFYSLLNTALKHEEINHPRLLYLDSPRDQELKWERFCESILKFKELLSKNTQGQVFITVVVDGNNRLEGKYAELNEHVFMNLTNKEDGRLLRKIKGSIKNGN